MASSKLMPLYEQIARLIEGQIETGHFQPGQKIYSIREICQQFEVADVTAKAALRLLGQRGLIRTVSGSGAFVADRDVPATTARQTTHPAAAMLKVGLHPAAVFLYEIDMIQQELSRLDYPMLYSATRDEEAVPRAVDQLLGAGARCLIVFPRHLRSNYEQTPYMSDLRRRNVPLLVLESRGQKDSYVTADTERATRELADYLYDVGHRRICLAASYHRKTEGFATAVERWRDPSVTQWVVGRGGRTDRDLHQLAAQILDLKPRPTAVIANCDQSAAVMISHFQTAGLRVPDDISVVAFGDHPDQAALSPVPVTVVRHPCVEIAQEVAHWARAHIAGSPPRRRHRREITGTLIIRDSSGPPAGK